jgi:hypothetical protein
VCVPSHDIDAETLRFAVKLLSAKNAKRDDGMFERVCVTFGLYNRGRVMYIYVPLSSPFPRDIFAFIDECSYCLDGSNG